MRYLLDSDSLSDLYTPSSPGHLNISRRLTALLDEDLVFVSVLAVFELEYGWANAPEDKKPFIHQRIARIQTDFSLLPLTPEAARVFGLLKAQLRTARQLSQEKIKVHNVDLMLAATAIAEDCALVSGDGLYSDLGSLNPALKIENWLI
jgi:predicted nucleic acid-binding protein